MKDNSGRLNGLPMNEACEQSSPSVGIPDAFAALTEAMKDPEYAWAWHCNLAVPIMDATGISHEQANIAAAHLMQHLWGCDITTHPHYHYDKSAAQEYAETRIAADREEDAQTIEARRAATLGAVHESVVAESDAPVPMGDSRHEG